MGDWKIVSAGVLVGGPAIARFGCAHAQSVAADEGTGVFGPWPVAFEKLNSVLTIGLSEKSHELQAISFHFR